MSAEADPATRGDFLNALAGAADDIGGFFAGLDAEAFWDGTPERWSAAHHLDHLIRSSLPVANGLGAARGRLQPLPAEHQSRTYAQIEAEYRAALSSGAKAFGRWLPQPEGDQTELVGRYRASLDAVNDALAGWSNTELDAWAMPYPALDVLSVRGTPLFTLMRNRHHWEGVRARFNVIETRQKIRENDSL